MDIVVDKVFLVELFDRFPMAVAVADRSKKIVYANKRYTELFGAKEIVQESVRCRDVFGCLRPNDNTDGSRPVKCQTCIFSLSQDAALEGKTTKRKQWLVQHHEKAEQGLHLVEISTSPITVKGDPYILTILEDISQNAELSMADGKLLSDFMEKNS